VSMNLTFTGDFAMRNGIYKFWLEKRIVVIGPSLCSQSLNFGNK